MKQPGPTGANKTMDVDWLEFQSQTDPQKRWRIHVPFFLSTWSCLFGRGCPGLTFHSDQQYDSRVGCCRDGAYFNSAEDIDKTAKYVDMLTEEDLEPARLNHIKKNGWLHRKGKDNDGVPNAKTRINDGVCALSRVDGKGCSLLHLSARLKGQSLEEIDHTEAMPTVCWQLPIKRGESMWENDPEVTLLELFPWDVDQWADDPQMTWWCVDDAAAYNTTSTPLYLTMEAELRKIMGAVDYSYLAERLAERAQVKRPYMPAELPGGVSLNPVTSTSVH
jgi:hypothetical protein